MGSAKRRRGVDMALRRMCRVACAGLVLLASCAGTSHWLKLLNAGDEQERLRAISEIASSGAATTQVLGALSQALADPSPAVRWESAGALGRLGPRAAATLPALLDCAQGKQEALALRCAHAAAAVGPGALSGLRGLLASPDAVTRRRGALAIAGLGTAAVPAVDELISLLGDADTGVSAAAIDALVAIGPQALLPLLKMARGRAPTFGANLQARARTAIDAMKPYSATVLLDLLTRGGEATYWAVEKIRAQGMEAEAVPLLIRMLKSGRLNNVSFASQVLGSFGSKAEPAIPALAAILRDSSPYFAGAAAALAGIGEASLPVAEEFLRAPDELLRIKGIRILGEMRPIVYERLLDLAHGEDKRLRQEALEILGRTDSMDLPALLALSRDPETVLRRSAVLRLGRIPPWNEKAGEALARLLLQDPDTMIRYWSAVAFGQMGGAAAPAKSALIQALADPSDEVRRKAAAALATIGEEAIPGLLEAFCSGNAVVRASVLAVFSELRTSGRVTDSMERELRTALVRDDAAMRAGASFALLVVGRGRSEEISVAAAGIRSGGPALVRLALFALREAGVAASEALPALLEIAPGIDQDLSGEYLETLARVGRRDPRLIPVYIDALRRGEVSKQAREGLEWFDDDAIAPLLALLGEKDVKDRAALEKALLERGAAAVPALETALAAGDASARRIAAALLCRQEKVPPQAMPVFLAVLQQNDQSEWPQALRCLTKAGAALAPHADLLAKLYERMKETGRIEVVDALGSCGESARPYIPLLVAAVQGPAESGDRRGAASSERNRRWDVQENLRQHAIQTLGKLGSVAAAAAPVLVGFVEERGGDSSAQSAIDALGMIGPAAREAVPMLVPLLDSPDEAVQEATLNALVAIGAPRDVLAPKCLALLRDEQSRLRQLALKYLVGSGCDSEDFKALLEQLAHGTSLAFEATRALRQMRPPSGGFVLIAPTAPGYSLTQWGVEVGWGQGVPGASGYRFFRREEPDGEWALVEESGVLRFDDYGVEPGKVYAYRVEAFNADADGPPSNVQTIPITGTQVREQHAPPTGLTVETASIRRGDKEIRVARLKWEAPRGWDCRGYVIFRGLIGSNLFGPIGVSRSPSFVDEKTERNYSVSYFIRGIDADFRQSEASKQGVVAAASLTR